MDIPGAPAHEALGLRVDRLAPAARAALAIALAALWLLGRRYGGFIHDASIYVLQGLRVRDPAAFAGDLFFAYGAQDAYTVFPRLYAPLIGAFGAGNAALMVTIAGQVAFFAAAAALIFRICAGPARWWSLALLAALSGYYGGEGVFRLAEPFATARTLAEPLVLAALCCTLAARQVATLALLAAAAVLHPLVAAPGFAVVFLWHAIGRPRLLWLIPVFAGLMPALALAWPEIMLRFDAPWLSAVLERSPHLFVSHWPLADWSRLLWGLCVVWLSLRVLEAPVRRLVLAALAAGLGGVAASWLAVDLLDSAFVAGLQLWRAHWLLHFFAIVLVPVAAAGLWHRQNNAARAAAACIAASCCFGRAELPAAAVLAVLAVIFDAAERRWPDRLPQAAYKAILVSVLTIASAGLLFEIQFRLPNVYGATRAPAWTDYISAMATVGGLLPIALVLWLAACSRFAYAAAGLATALLGVSVAAWDARAPWPRLIEQASEDANPFRDVLPPGAQVFWPGSHGRTWLVLGRPAWFSDDQGAGIVFNRQTALEYAERKRASRGLESAIGNCAATGDPACRIDARLARELCVHQRGPDFLVLNARIDGHAGIEWPLPPEIGPGRQSLFLYACSPFRADEKKAGARPAFVIAEIPRLQRAAERVNVGSALRVTG